MSWAGRRRFLILSIIATIGIAFIATILIATIYEAPSCADATQNQGETGVDCGGPCAYLCVAHEEPPTVLFTKALKNGLGRVDAVAEIENKNIDAAAKNVPYKIMLYGADQTLVREVTGTVELPPGTTVPVFVPGISSGLQIVSSAFLTIQPTDVRWFASPVDTRVIPAVSAVRQTGSTLEPRIEATLTNPSANALSDVRVAIFVRNNRGEVIAASATLLSTIPAQGEALATFTWNEPFSSVPASFKVTPLIPLP
jgi:hypothetical protein